MILIQSYYQSSPCRCEFILKMANSSFLFSFTFIIDYFSTKKDSKLAHLLSLVCPDLPPVVFPKVIFLCKAAVSYFAGMDVSRDRIGLGVDGTGLGTGFIR